MKNQTMVKKKKGFTLVELVAVVAIIGILAAILVPKVTSYMNEAKKVKVIDQGRKVITAIESYNMKNDVVIAKNNTTIDELFTANSAIKAFVDPDNSGKETEKLNITVMTVEQVYKIVEDKNDFKVDGSGTFTEMIN